MNALIEELSEIARNPWAWGVVAIMGAITLKSIWHWRTCPYCLQIADITEDDIREAQQNPFAASWRFALWMAMGFAITLAGLAMIATGMRPAIALALLVTGVFVIRTEPLRLSLNEGVKRVVASIHSSEEQRMAAIERLQGNHRSLILAHLTLFVALFTAMIAF